MPDDPELVELTLLMWAAWGFAALMALVLVAVFVGGWWWTSRQVFVDFVRARAARDLWAPFLRDEHGEWGRLVSSRQKSVFRAETRGSSTGLWMRWGPLLYLHGMLTLMLLGAVIGVLVTLGMGIAGSLSS